jgi:hypothetical protein
MSKRINRTPIADDDVKHKINEDVLPYAVIVAAEN